MTRKVLILGGERRSGLAVVRSLGRKGISVHLAWYPPDSIVPFSKYTAKTHVLPQYDPNDCSWLNALTALLEGESFDLVVPTTDGVMLPIVRERHSLEKVAKLAIPTDEAFFCAFNKSETNRLAQRLGIPVPRQVLVSVKDNLAEIDIDMEFPLVVKPVSSVVDPDISTTRLCVGYAYSKEQLFVNLKELLLITPVLVQEYFVGTGMGVELLAEKGQILCAFQHARVHEPIYGGGSSYRKSVPLNPKLLGSAEKLMSALQWTGVAMIEFKYNDDANEFVLIEINGRFWGSLPLAMAAGLDFPYYLYQLLVEGKKSFSTTYKKDIYCRNLRLDGYWFLQNLCTRPSKYNNALPLWKLLREPLNILMLREHYDTFALDDWRPGLKEIGAILRIIKLKVQPILVKYLLRLFRAKEVQLERLRLVCAKSSLNVCFVCKGNICRSPFAEYYLKKILLEKGRQVSVQSAGYYQKELRPCLTEAIWAAKKFNVDLSQHRSRIVSAKVVSQNDVVFVFDIQNWAFLRKKFRHHKSKIFFLGSLANGSQIQILLDPYGKREKTFDDTYSAIVPLIDSLVDILGRTQT